MAQLPTLATAPTSNIVVEINGAILNVVNIQPTKDDLISTLGIQLVREVASGVAGITYRDNNYAHTSAPLMLDVFLLPPTIKHSVSLMIYRR